MNGKFMAGVTTAIVVAPVCAVCILGPALIGSFLGGFAGWFGGLDPLAVAGLAMAIGVLAIVIAKRRHAATPKADPKKNLLMSAPIGHKRVNDDSH